jgi:hypothetical protein
MTLSLAQRLMKLNLNSKIRNEFFKHLNIN